MTTLKDLAELYISALDKGLKMQGMIPNEHHAPAVEAVRDFAEQADKYCVVKK